MPTREPLSTTTAPEATSIGTPSTSSPPTSPASSQSERGAPASFRRLSTYLDLSRTYAQPLRPAPCRRNRCPRRDRSPPGRRICTIALVDCSGRPGASHGPLGRLFGSVLGESL